MKKSSLISVIIPLYNHQRYIGECLQSVYRQTYQNLELIIVDDGTTDGSREAAGRSLQSCPFPSQLIEQTNQGAHAAINRGIRASKGEYLSILNSDDCYHPQRLETLESQAKKFGSRFLFSKINHIDQEGNSLDPGAAHCYYYHLSRLTARFFPLIEFELLRHNLAITSSNFFIQRSLAEQVGDFADLKTCHDWDYLLRALSLERPRYVARALLDYRVHSGSTLIQKGDLREEEIDQVLSNYLARAGHFINPYAPGPAAWGYYWTIFRIVYLQHLNHYPQTKICLSESVPDGSPIPGKGGDRAAGIYRRIAWRVFNQFLWQQEILLDNKPSFKMQLHRGYIYLVSRMLGKIGWLFK